MKIFQLDEWQSVVILEKVDKRLQPINLIDSGTNIYSSFRINSRDIVDRASFVCYVEDGVIKTVLKNRYDDDRYEPLVQSIILNDIRHKKLQRILS